MSLDPFLTLASFGIGIVVGLTGMGGGALMTPVLVLFFHIPPLTAVSSDLVADQRPDYVVLLEVYGRRTLLRDDRFTSGYELIETLPTDIYGSEGMLIFRRLAP